MGKKRQALAQELSAVRIDMSKVNALHQELKALMAQMEDARLQDILKVREILGPEKFPEFARKMDEMMHQQGRFNHED